MIRRKNILTGKIDKKRLLGIFLLAIFLMGGGFFKFLTQKSEAAWYDENFAYRQAVTVTVSSNSSAISNLETLITVDTSTLITAGKLQSSCQDLRFTSNTGKLLSYYIDSGCNTTTTKIWVMIDSVPANTTTYTAYLYYGNPSATAGSDNQKFTLFRGLVGYWGMNESSWNGTSSEVKDFSPSGNNGTSVNGATTTTSGQYANAGSFDGSNDYVEVPNATSNNFSSSAGLTVSAWVNPANTSTSSIIGKWDNGTSTGRQFVLYTLNVSGSLYAEFSVSGDGTGRASKYGNTAIPTGSWSHIVSVWKNDGTMQIYVNGILQTLTDFSSSQSIPTSLHTSTRNICIGIGNNANADNCASNTGPLNGKIDDARIYNRDLSATEISQLYQNPGILASYSASNINPTTSFATEEKAPQPVAYWKFNEGTGTTANDATTNKNTATLVNMSSTIATNSGWLTEDMCVSGKCLGFDGQNDYVQATRNSQLEPSVLTVAAWIKTNPDTSSNHHIISKCSSDSSCTTGYALFTNAGPYTFLVRGLSTTVVSAGVNPSGNWDYVVGVYNGSTLSIYVNGVLKNSVSVTGSISHSSQDVYMGRWSNTTTPQYFTGRIDEAKIYPYARSAAQVKADFSSRGGSIGSSGVLGSSLNSMPSALSNGLVGYWKMDESSWNGTTNEVRDSSGAGNNGTAGCNGTCTSSVPSTTGGKFGNGGGFDGTNQRVSVPTSTSLSPSSTLSVCAWIKPSATPANQRIIEKSTTTSYSLLHVSNGAPRFTVLVGGSVVSATSSTVDTSGQWTQVCGTYDGTSVRVYQNGVTTAQTAASGALGTDSNNVIFGFASGGAFNGTIDEARVYNRALSPADVATLYNFAPGPVGYWKLDEKSGTSASDTSGNGNTGTLTNGPMWVRGKVGGAVQFDGSNDYIGVSNLLVSTNQDFTYEAWVKTLDGNKEQTLINHSVSGGRSFQFRYQSNYGRFMLEIDGGTAAYIYKTIPVNEFTHVGLTVNGSTILFYINGVAYTTTSGSINLSTLTGIALGGRPGGLSADAFTGLLDDIKVYNYARTGKQIMQDMQGAHTAVAGARAGSMVGYWKMDEGYGTTARDYSGSGNSGTLTNMASPGTSTSGWSNNGKFNKALNFDGSDDYVTYPTTLPTTNFSISVWFKTNASSGQTMFTSTDSTRVNGVKLRLDSTGVTKVYVEPNTSTVGTKAYNDGKWHQMLVSASSTETKVYMDGVVDKTYGAALLSGTYTFYKRIGDGGAQEFFNGSIDEVKIYNYALTASDVKTDYNRGASQQFGSTGTSSSGVADNSRDRMYCPPGDSTGTCGPVGEWNFEEGQGSSVNDSSGNGNTGTWNGTGPAHYVAGKVGKGGGFDGSTDFMSIPDSSSLNVSTNFTVSGWIKFNGGGSTPTIYDSGTQSNRWFIALVGGKLDFTERSIANNVANTTLDSNWHHFSVVKNGDSGTNLSMYLDGKLDGTASVGTVTTPSGAKNIGKWTESGLLYWPGNIDQLKIYNYARSAAQIAWDYNRGAPVAQWKMDECQGAVVRDMTGNGNDGVITIGGSGSQTTAGTCTTSSTAWGNGASGKINSSLKFDGTDDYFQAADSDMLSPSTLSLGMWIKWDGTRYSSGAQKDWASPIAKGQFSSGEYTILMHRDSAGSDTNINFYVGGSTAVSWSNSSVDTNWHHLGITYDGATAKIYFDGVLKKSTSYSGSVGNTTNPLRIGGESAGLAYPWGGQLDDVRIYNYPMTANQIKDLSNGGAVKFAPSSGNP
jgi:hypothetical protein